MIKKYVFCLFLLLWGQLFAQKTYTLPEYPKELSTKSNRILIEELIETDITNINKISVKKRQVWLVLNKTGHRATNLYEFYDDNSRIKSIRAQYYDAQGNRQTYLKKKKDFQDRPHAGENLYSDSRIVSAVYHPTSYPYVVVFESETESGDTAFINRWAPLSGYASSTYKSTYKIKFDPKNKVRYKPMNFDGFNITVDETPEELIFTAENLTALQYEEYSPYFTAIFPHANFALDHFMLKGKQGTATSWKSFGKWMEEELLGDVNEIPEHTIQRIKNLVANEETNEGKARKIYQFLQDKVRYVSVQIGIGGWKPMPAAEVDKLSYGDCKALTNYTKVLLDALGISSYYTVLYADSNTIDIHEDFVSFQGNHVILGIPDGDKITWLECTSQETPYGFIGSVSHNRNVLMLTPEGGEIVRTKTYAAEENSQKTVAQVQVAKTGKITASVSRESYGLQYETKFRLPKLKAADVETFYRNEWSYINRFLISDVSFDNNREAVVFKEKLKIETDSYVKPVSEGFLLIPNIFNQRLHVPPQIPNRKNPLEIAYGYIDEDTIEIRLPQGLSVRSVPDSVNLETKFGTYQVAFEQVTSELLVYKRRLKIQKGVFPAEEYVNYREFIRNVNRLDNELFVLITSD